VATDYPELYQVSKEATVAVVRLKGPSIVELTVIDRIEKGLVALADEVRISGMVVDFRRIKHASSPLFGKLIKVRNLLAKKPAKMALSRMTEDMAKVMRLIRMDRLVSLHDDLSEAVRACL